MESEVVWKTQSLQFVCLILRKKLGKPHSAENLIAIISEHFPVGIQQAEHDAEAIVAKFRSCFGNVAFLSPIGFYNSYGDDITDKCIKRHGRQNACFLETNFELPLSRLGAPFSVYQRFDITYWLHLPQSGPRKKTAAAAASSSTGSSLTDRSSLFSIVMNLQSKFIFTPGVVVTSDGGSDPPDVINLSGSAPASAAKLTGSPSISTTGKTSSTVDGEKSETGGTYGGGTASRSISPGNSDSGFDAVKEKLHPKTAELLASRRAHGSASLRSYYGPLDILENQSAFDDAGMRCSN